MPDRRFPAALDGPGPSMSSGLLILRVFPFEQTHLDNARQISSLWSTGRSDTRSALASSETNGPCRFIPQTSKARE